MAFVTPPSIDAVSIFLMPVAHDLLAFSPIIGQLQLLSDSANWQDYGGGSALDVARAYTKWLRLASVLKSTGYYELYDLTTDDLSVDWAKNGVRDNQGLHAGTDNNKRHIYVNRAYSTAQYVRGVYYEFRVIDHDNVYKHVDVFGLKDFFTTVSRYNRDALEDNPNLVSFHENMDSIAIDIVLANYTTSNFDAVLTKLMVF